MQLNPLSPRKSLNKAYLKVKPTRSNIERFKLNLIGLLDGLDESESEEHNKNDLGDFLKNTFYHPKFYINTKDRTDLVIHNGNDAKGFAGVLIEAKKPSNKTEMIRPDNLNAKAFHELILYYLRERITNHNLEIKHLVVTNIYEWYVFDAALFEKTFAQDKTLVKQFTDFEEGRLAGKSTDFFYNEIAEPFVAGLTSEFYFTWFDFRDYDKPLRNEDKKDDSKLIALYKLLSPEHLLKLPFANDSNSLDKTFYAELLHIIGLAETKEGSKKLIGRKKEGERNSGSFIESAIIQLDSLDKISRLEKPSQFGETVQERLFNVALELSITWINRILFLKLLEAQLIRYHKGDPAYAFLNCEKVQNFDDLNTLFFSVLARKHNERDEEVRKTFGNIPYLNSSLFEPTAIEHSCLFISQLKDGKLPILASTVLKDNNGKKFKGELFTLEYLFKFLDAYDFAGEGSEEIQEENKTLINASVLGLIFEKINGYKDGSFFTPGFITMYMCHETIRRAVVQKFNERKGWNCEDLKGVYDKIEDKKEANEIINQLKICDPAVGSGHFLVSALNEIISIKSELKILSDKEGKRLKEYHVEVVNDELIITDEDGKLFEYNPNSPESQRVQEAIFHEKQTIIENCLFGVDINPNSVKICRLRLWIELLKNAYYRQPQSDRVTESQEELQSDKVTESQSKKLTNSPRHHGTTAPLSRELETLPNIDINIKCGNSLISRYSLDADIRQALKKSKWNIESYRLAVMTYRNAENKEQKRVMADLIEKIKNDFQMEISLNDPKKRRLDKLAGELYHRFTGNFLFEAGTDYGSNKAEEKGKEEQTKIENEISKITKELEEVKNNKIYENSFEWRFEFPEVLNDEGDFMGFDIVMGNPPYVVLSNVPNKNELIIFQKEYITQYKTDLYHLFIQRGLSLLRPAHYLCFIVPQTWMTQIFTRDLREFLMTKHSIESVILLKDSVFDEANVYTEILLIQNNISNASFIKFHESTNNEIITEWKQLSKKEITAEVDYSIDIRSTGNIGILLRRINQEMPKLKEVARASLGCQAYNSSKHTKEEIENRIYHSDHQINEEYLPELAGNDVSRYYYHHIKGTWLKYGSWLHDYRSMEWFTGPRILLREITGKGVYKIQATYIEETYCNYKTILNVIPEKESKMSMKYLCGLLNSKLLSFIFSNSSNKIEAKSFPRLSVGDLKNFPIKEIDSLKAQDYNNHLEIISFVDQILITKKSSPSADTSALEKEIDRLVYELYELTEEEIGIVEEN